MHENRVLNYSKDHRHIILPESGLIGGGSAENICNYLEQGTLDELEFWATAVLPLQNLALELLFDVSLFGKNKYS